MAATDHVLPTPLAVSVSDGQAVLRVAGDLDGPSTEELRTALDVLAGQRVTSIVVDVRAVPRLDPAAVELLAATHTRLCSRGGRLCVAGSSPGVEDLLRRRGLQGLLRAG